MPLSHKYGLGLDPSTFAHEAADGYASGVAAVPPWVAPDVILRDSMTTLLVAYGTPSPAEVDDFFALWRSLNPWEDVPSSLWALHNHFTLVILSNMSVATQSALMDRAGLPFDRTLSAETVEAYKPGPAVYEMAISSLGLAPDEIMMVAAHKYDLAAARSRGFATAFVARALEQGPAGTVDTTPDPTADINATSFTGVVHALGADPPSLDEDGIAINPEAVEVQQIAGSWKVITVTDGSSSSPGIGPARALTPTPRCGPDLDHGRRDSQGGVERHSHTVNTGRTPHSPRALPMTVGGRSPRSPGAYDDTNSSAQKSLAK